MICHHFIVLKKCQFLRGNAYRKVMLAPSDESLVSESDVKYVV
jgi:hypothetical protein